MIEISFVPVLACILFMMGTLYLTQPASKQNMALTVVVACGIAATITIATLCAIWYVFLLFVAL